MRGDPLFPFSTHSFFLGWGRIVKDIWWPNHQLFWVPLGHVWFLTGLRIASILASVCWSFPNVESSMAAPTFSSTWSLKSFTSLTCQNISSAQIIKNFLKNQPESFCIKHKGLTATLNLGINAILINLNSIFQYQIVNISI